MHACSCTAGDTHLNCEWVTPLRLGGASGPPHLRHSLAPPAGLCPLVPGDNDIDQLGRVITVFGSVEAQWGGVKALPDWGKISFNVPAPVGLEKLMPGQSQSALALLAGMLR
jgi:hypothetical protein